MKKIIALMIAILLTLTMCEAFADNVYTDKTTVKAVQQALNAAGYNCGTPDGIAGKKTYAAIEAYQKDKQISVTGTIDDALLQSLGLVTASKEATAAPVDNSNYTKINNGSTPQMPAKLIEATGGIPDSLDVLSERYHFDEIKTMYEKWEPTALSMMNDLVDKGTMVIPDYLVTSGSEIELKFDYEDMYFYVDKQDGQTMIRLQEPLGKDVKGHLEFSIFSAGIRMPGIEYHMSRELNEKPFDNCWVTDIVSTVRKGSDYYYAIRYYDDTFDISAGEKNNTWFGDYDKEGRLISVSHHPYTMG